MSDKPRPAHIGLIHHWPGGYAMLLGHSQWPVYSAATCCDGHETPAEAKAHGLLRLTEVASLRADADIALWNQVAA